MSRGARFCQRGGPPLNEALLLHNTKLMHATAYTTHAELNFFQPVSTVFSRVMYFTKTQYLTWSISNHRDRYVRARGFLEQLHKCKNINPCMHFVLHTITNITSSFLEALVGFLCTVGLGVVELGGFCFCTRCCFLSFITATETSVTIPITIASYPACSFGEKRVWYTH